MKSYAFHNLKFHKNATTSLFTIYLINLIYIMYNPNSTRFSTKLPHHLSCKTLKTEDHTLRSQ